MPRLPIVGSDDGTWGNYLNAFLEVSLDNTNVDEGERGKLKSSAVDAAGAVMNSDTSTAAMSFVVDEDNMTSDSATKVPTQQSVKAYVDTSVSTKGDVSGPASSTTNAIPRYSSTTGKLLKDSAQLTADDNGNITIGKTTPVLNDFGQIILKGYNNTGSTQLLINSGGSNPRITSSGTGNQIQIGSPSGVDFVGGAGSATTLARFTNTNFNSSLPISSSNHGQTLNLQSMQWTTHSNTIPHVKLLTGTVTPSALGAYTGVEIAPGMGAGTTSNWTVLKVNPGADNGGATRLLADFAVGGSSKVTINTAGDISTTGTIDGRDIAADGTKLDGIETGADVTDATNVDTAGAVMNTDTSTASMSFVVDEDDMTSNSATKVPTQQSVKAYVDTHAPTANGVATVFVHDGDGYQLTGGRIFVGPEDPAADGFTMVDGDMWEVTP